MDSLKQKTFLVKKEKVGSSNRETIGAIKINRCVRLLSESSCEVEIETEFGNVTDLYKSKSGKIAKIDTNICHWAASSGYFLIVEDIK